MVRYGNDKIDEKIIYNSIYFNFPIENLRCWSYFQQVQTFIYPENHIPLKKENFIFLKIFNMKSDAFGEMTHISKKSRLFSLEEEENCVQIWRETEKLLTSEYCDQATKRRDAQDRKTGFTWVEGS